MPNPSDQVPFFSLRSEELVDLDDKSTPVGMLVQRLKEAGIPFAVDEFVWDRDKAARSPDHADLYPDGPNSGPEKIVVYAFVTDHLQIENADRVAKAFISEMEAAG